MVFFHQSLLSLQLLEFQSDFSLFLGHLRTSVAFLDFQIPLLGVQGQSLRGVPLHRVAYRPALEAIAWDAYFHGGDIYREREVASRFYNPFL